MCDVIIACISHGTFPTLVGIIFLLALDCAMQVLTHLSITAVVYEDL